MYRKVCLSSLPPICTPPLPATRLFPTQTFPKFATVHFSGKMFMALFKDQGITDGKIKPHKTEPKIQRSNPTQDNWNRQNYNIQKK
jgi:hypothetical protein